MVEDYFLLDNYNDCHLHVARFWVQSSLLGMLRVPVFLRSNCFIHFAAEYLQSYNHGGSLY